MKSFLLSSLAAASTLAIGALAFAGDATFELWSSVVDKERSYALVNMETQETVALSGSGKKLALTTGDAADATLENLKAQMPENVEIVVGDQLSGDHEINIMIDGDGEDVTEIITENISESIVESENGKKHVRIMIDKSGDRTIVKAEDLPEDVRALLREEGVTVEGDKQVRIIRKKVDVETAGDGTSKKTIVIRTAPDTPTPPDVPIVADGETKTKIITRSKKKSSYEYHDDGDKGEGIEKSFTHFSGASPEDAAEFIDEIEGLKRRQKKQAKTALGL